MISPRTWKLSVRRQCELLSISRSRIYYKPVAEKPENLKMMEIMDKHLAMHLTEGVMSMVYLFLARNYHVGPKRIRRLFKIMGRGTLYRRKGLTKQGLWKYIKPYLLRGMEIKRPNQVWCADITYIPMKKGFMYLTAKIDIYSRKIVGWGISNSLSSHWCKNVLEEAIASHGQPEIVNTDQGAQYTSAVWAQYLEKLGILMSMDGKGRATVNIWIERFWKSIKYDYIYLNSADDGFELYGGVQNHIAYYNNKTHHTTRQAPNERYHGQAQKAA